MIKATIKKLNGTYLDHGDFASEEAALTWFQPFIDKGVYGKPESSYESLVDGEVEPAVYETIVVPAEFTIEYEEFVDNSQQIRESKEALAFLAETDYYIIREIDSGVACPQEIKEQRAIARTKVIK